MKKPRKNEAVEPVKVHCCDCQLCTRDTSGRCFNIDTGEFFMGTCSLGHGEGVPGRVFMDKPRECKDFKQL